MRNNDISFNIDWNEIQNFPTKKSALRGSWMTLFYNDGCKRKGIKCFMDFYNVIGVNFDGINPREGNKIRRLRPHEIRANPITVDKICDYIHEQYHPTKYKGRRPSAIGLDCLNYSPFSDEEISENIVIIRIDNSIEWNEKEDYIEGESKRWD